MTSVRGFRLIVWCVMLLFALSACGEDEPDVTVDEPTDVEEESVEEPAEEPDEPDVDDTADEYEAQTISVAHVAPEVFPYHDAFLKFEEVIEERSGGVIDVEIFPGGQLGGEIDILEQILDGTVHFGVGAGGLGSFASIVDLGQLPFLIRGQDHLQAIYGSEAGAMLRERVEEESDFYVLTFFTTGDSPISTTERAIESVDDLSGLTIRVIENEATLDGFRTLGANPTPIPFPEVYTALQQGVADGSHLDWLAMFAIQANEVLNYATTPDAPALAEPRYVVVAKDWWDGLDPATQDLVAEAAEAASQENFDVHLERQAELLAGIEDEMQITEIDVTEFEAVMEPVWQEWAERLGAEDILEAIIDVRP